MAPVKEQTKGYQTCCSHSGYLIQVQEEANDQPAKTLLPTSDKSNGGILCRPRKRKEVPAMEKIKERSRTECVLDAIAEQIDGLNGVSDSSFAMAELAEAYARVAAVNIQEKSLQHIEECKASLGDMLTRKA